MTVTAIHKDFDQLTLTLVADLDAPVERVWQLWSDPRQLERWWGPPTYPATFDRFDLRPGGKAAYTMTGPAGDRSRGWWEIVAVDPPRSLEFRATYCSCSRWLAEPRSTAEVCQESAWQVIS